VTDGVIAHFPLLNGKPFLSPDSRWLVTFSPQRRTIKNNKLKIKKNHSKNKIKPETIKSTTDFVIHQITRMHAYFSFKTKYRR
jgi:hypothetical protein